MQEKIKELVLARLRILPPDASISIGSDGSYSKNDLIEHVQKNDELGKKITEIELEYLKMFKEGFFYAQQNSSY